LVTYPRFKIYDLKVKYDANYDAIRYVLANILKTHQIAKPEIG
jgi:hypothetical protein